MKIIKHLRITFENGTDHYLCNHACSIIKEKCVWEEKKVTCKNCLKILAKKPFYAQTRGYKVIEQVAEEIEKFKNPYPKDIFKWDNKKKLNFNRGRFNKFIYNVVENTKKDIIKHLKEGE